MKKTYALLRVALGCNSPVVGYPTAILVCFSCLLLAVHGRDTVSATDVAPRLFGADVTTWKKPPPMAVPALASPMMTREVVTARTEGQRFMETLKVEERETLLKEKFYLVAKEDPDSPSLKRAGDAGVKGYIRALALFDQPKERVLELLFDPEKQDLYLKDLDEAETLARQTGVGELTKCTINIWFWHVDYWVQQWFYPEHSRMEWFLDTDHFENDINGMTGFWQLYALSENQSVGEYGIAVDTGIPFPRSWKEAIQRRRIPGAMKEFIHYVDSNGQYGKK